MGRRGSGFHYGSAAFLPHIDSSLRAVGAKRVANSMRRPHRGAVTSALCYGPSHLSTQMVHRSSSLIPGDSKGAGGVL
jgi:hypothetical protein